MRARARELDTRLIVAWSHMSHHHHTHMSHHHTHMSHHHTLPYRLIVAWSPDVVPVPAPISLPNTPPCTVKRDLILSKET